MHAEIVVRAASGCDNKVQDTVTASWLMIESVVTNTHEALIQMLAAWFVCSE